MIFLENKQAGWPEAVSASGIRIQAEAKIND